MATGKAGASDAGARIDARIAELDDWRGAALARVRRVIRKALPEVTETWKWRGVPVWEQDGIICTGESYRDKLKLTFARGAALADPRGLFNASLTGKLRRAIDIAEDAFPNETALAALVRAAARENAAKAKGKAKAKAG